MYKIFSPETQFLLAYRMKILISKSTLVFKMFQNDDYIRIKTHLVYTVKLLGSHLWNCFMHSSPSNTLTALPVCIHGHIMQSPLKGIPGSCCVWASVQTPRVQAEPSICHVPANKSPISQQRTEWPPRYNLT